MELILDSENFDYAGLTSRQGADEVGFTVAITHPLDMPVIQQAGKYWNIYHLYLLSCIFIIGLKIGPGTSNQLGIGVQIMDIDQAVLSRYPEPEDRKCYENSDINFKFLLYENDFHYSMSNCLVEASIQSAERQCGCIPGEIKASDNPCQGPRLKCFTDIMNMIGTNEEYPI